MVVGHTCVDFFWHVRGGWWSFVGGFVGMVLDIGKGSNIFSFVIIFVLLWGKKKKKKKDWFDFEFC